MQEACERGTQSRPSHGLRRVTRIGSDCFNSFHFFLLCRSNSPSRDRGTPAEEISPTVRTALGRLISLTMLKPIHLLILSVLALPASSAAQLPIETDPGRSVRTRADLERLLGEYDAALASPAYSEGVKRSIRADRERIRTRLQEGDFRVGDRIAVYVQGEPNFPDTLVVQPGPSISFENFGDISLHGVLRAELEPHLYQELSRFIRSPIVRANGLMRLTLVGGIRTPGFYTVPPETLLGDVIMMAGGPSTGRSDFEGIRIQRAGRVLYEDREVEAALRNALTLDQLNLQAGDQIELPLASSRNVLQNVLAVMGALGTVTFILFQTGVLRR